MSPKDPTFGCGQYLPGYGPFNFPDFIGGGVISGPGGGGGGGNNPGINIGEQDPTDPDLIDPPGPPPLLPEPPGPPVPGGPSTPGPGPAQPPGGPQVVPPGPGSPGPQVPGGPQTPPTTGFGVKYCRINTFQPGGPNSGSNIFRITYRATQTCVTTNTPSQYQNLLQRNADKIAAVIQAATANAGPNDIVTVSQSGNGGELCPGGSNCPDVTITITIRYRSREEPGGPVIIDGNNAPGNTDPADPFGPPSGVEPSPPWRPIPGVPETGAPRPKGNPWSPIPQAPDAPGPSNPLDPGSGPFTPLEPQTPISPGPVGPGPFTPLGPQTPISPGPVGPGPITPLGPQTPISPGPRGPSNFPIGPQTPIGPSFPESPPWTPIPGVPTGPPPVQPGGPFTPLGPQTPISPGPVGPSPPIPPDIPGILAPDPGGEGGGGTSIDPQNPTNPIGAAFSQNNIDLNDPLLQSRLMSLYPAGTQDPDIFISKTPNQSSFVRKPIGIGKELFFDVVDSKINYLLTKSIADTSWDSSKPFGMTATAIWNSLKPDIVGLLSRIKNYDGTPLTDDQVYSLIGSRVIDGTINKVTRSFLASLARVGEKNKGVTITRSRNPIVNEIAALNLIEQKFHPLNPSGSLGRSRQTLKNHKVLASDVDKFIELEVSGVVRKHYINDDGTFIERSDLTLSDGDYVEVFVSGVPTKIFAKSEDDHAFLIPERTRQKAISVLGGSPDRVLSVSAPITSGIETNNSLSSPRENFYFLSAVLSSVNSKPAYVDTDLLVDTEMNFDYVPAENIDEINEYIKYKGNYHVFVLHDEDMIFDYITSGAQLTLRQQDIISEAPKENKTNPLLTRQVPWYVLLYPTNREEFLVFNNRSEISDLQPSAVNDFGVVTTEGKVVREIVMKTSISPEFDHEFNNKFVKTQTDGVSAVDVLGAGDPQTRIHKIDLDDPMFTKGYRQVVGTTESITAAASYTPDRPKTGLRLGIEIIRELDQNYFLGRNGMGKNITEFDLYSRMNLSQYAKLTQVEGFDDIRRQLYNGLVEGVKVVPALSHADARIGLRKTQLIYRKAGALPDEYTPKKTTGAGIIVSPPSTEVESAPFTAPAPGPTPL